MYKKGMILYLSNKEIEVLGKELSDNGLEIGLLGPAPNNKIKVIITEATPKTELEILTTSIQDKKQLLRKYKEDVEQVELFGMERADYEEKKRFCANTILELRELEKTLKENYPEVDF